MVKPLSWRVLTGQAGMRLLPFLKEVCHAAPSVKALKRAIDKKCCRVNGQIETFSSFLLAKGDLVSLLPTSFDPPLQRAPTLLFEDDHLIALNKPSGTLSSAKELGYPQYHLIHRLDKETSGILLLAKTRAFQEKMICVFKEHAIHKYYLAIVDGIVRKDEGTIHNQLGKKSSYEGQTIYGSVGKGKGLTALTQWQCLSRGRKASLMACFPQTGRTHQIRVHLSEMGHPILGDRQYATHFKAPFDVERNLLHAYRIRFIHPHTHAPLSLTAPIPLDFQKAFTVLQLHLPQGNPS